MCVRLQLTSKIGGWKLKDELVESLGLTVGDSLNVEVSVLLGPNIISDNGGVDLFADGDAAEWLLNTVLDAGAVEGCVLDCKVRLVYAPAPVGGVEGKTVLKASLVLVKGLRFVSLLHHWSIASSP